MKKLLVIISALSFLLIPDQLVHAKVVSHATTRLQGGDSLELKAGNFFGFDIGGLINPIVIKPKENAVPDLEPYAVFTQKASPWALPLSLQKQIKPYTSSNPVSAMYCITQAIHYTWGTTPNNYIISKNPQISVNYPKSQEYIDFGKRVTSAYGLEKLVPDATGIIDQDLATFIVQNMGVGECKKADPGEELEPLVIPVPVLASVDDTHIQSSNVLENVIEAIITYINSAGKKVTDIIYAKSPIQEFAYVTIKNSDGNVAGTRAYYGRTNPEESLNDNVKKVAQQHASYNSSLLPEKELDKPIKYDHFENQNVDIGISNSFIKKPPNGPLLENVFKNAVGANLDSCHGGQMVAPKSQQNKLALGNEHSYINLANCKPNTTPSPTPAALCPIDQIAAGSAKMDVACHLNTSNFSSVFNSEELAGMGGTLSPLAVKVLDAAGSTYGVPAKVLIGFMLHEGAFLHPGEWDFSKDENIKTYSDCTKVDPMPKCREFPNNIALNAWGPFGFINFSSNGNKVASKESFPNFDDKNVSECNFVDAAYAAARQIAKDDSHLIFSGIPQMCGTLPVSQATNPLTQCTEWTSDRVALARMQYADRVCDFTVDRMVEIFNGL